MHPHRFILPLIFGSLLSCNGVENRQIAADPKPDANAPTIGYAQAKSIAESIRQSLKRAYTHGSAASKRTVLASAGDSLVKIIGDNFYTQWRGTPWDFNGTTKTPKEGSIACGYFVTGLLQDAGYKLNRVKLSTCPSLIMMKELTSPKAVKNLSALSYETFAKKIEGEGRNLYVVGLDFHTGFIVNDGKETWFLHSNYINKIGVVKEPIEESAALKASKTRFLACLTGNESFLKRWLLR